MAKHLIAFHGDAKIKERAITAVREQGKLGSIAEIVDWEKEFGIPEFILVSGDCIFDGLPDGKYQTFLEALLRAIPVGADLRLVYFLFMLWVLTDSLYGVLRHTELSSNTYKATNRVLFLVQRKIDGHIVQKRTWKKAEIAAFNAADSAFTVHSVYSADVATSIANNSDASAIDSAANAYGHSFSDFDKMMEEWFEAAANKLLELVKTQPLHEAFKQAA